MSSKLAECATPQTQSQCDKMDMDESETSFVAAPDRSCCFANAPLPVSQFKASGLSIASVPSVTPSHVGAAPRVRDAQPAVIVLAPSPPHLQALLCTFLI
jgi:hypothetical protein